MASPVQLPIEVSTTVPFSQLVNKGIEGQGSITKLPRELLKLIFTWLGKDDLARVSLVKKSWRSIALDKLLIENSLRMTARDEVEIVYKGFEEKNGEKYLEMRKMVEAVDSNEYNIELHLESFKDLMKGTSTQLNQSIINTTRILRNGQPSQL